MKVRVGINGFGSIGRRAFRIALDNPAVEIAAVNDLGNPEVLAHLLKYDSSYGPLAVDVRYGDGKLIVGERELPVFSERNPALIPWKASGVDVVIESTGVFNDGKEAAGHLKAGARKVIISAPAKNHDLTVVMGVNESQYNPARHNIISNASCTTNCLAPMALVLDRRFGIVNGLMTTVHSYTNDQQILDFPHRDWRRARSAALAIIPTTTGAAAAVAEVLPHLKGKLNGMAMRVPTPTVSVVDFTVLLKKEASAQEVNAAFRDAADSYLKGIMSVCDEPLVSIDFKGMSCSVAVDALSTQDVGKMVKVIGWYDNEWGYATRLIELVQHVSGASQCSHKDCACI